MLAVLLTGTREMKLAEIDGPPSVDPGWVLIKIKSVGICGSDIHYYAEGKIGSQVIEYPYIIGHECSGTVEVKGRGVTNVSKNDLVVIDPAICCGKCDQCLAGHPHTCRNLRFLGCPGQMEGCLTEYIRMPATGCFPVTGKLDADEAALIEPLSIGIYAVELAGITSQNTSVAIFGAGPIGLSILFKLIADGITRIGMIDPLDYRLEKAGQSGAAWMVNPGKIDVSGEVHSHEELLPDLVFEASGEQEAINNALKILRPGGKLVLVGIPASAEYIFNMDLMRRKEIKVINVRRQNHSIGEAIRLVTERKINIKQIVTHYFKLAETPLAFDMVAGYRDDVIKAIIAV
jgi:L-iditol 2-dehydrogenase